LLNPESLAMPLPFDAQAPWAAVAAQPPDLSCYNRLLEQV